jgi:hypothetical protein
MTSRFKTLEASLAQTRASELDQTRASELDHIEFL